MRDVEGRKNSPGCKNFWTEVMVRLPSMSTHVWKRATILHSGSSRFINGSHLPFVYISFSG